jgi:hypothetical protein
MTQAKLDRHTSDSAQPLPWYRYAWPWVAIAIPAVAVIGGLFTLYLAISNPDPLVVDEQQYEELRSGLLADPNNPSDPSAPGSARDDVDGDH